MQIKEFGNEIDIENGKIILLFSAEWCVDCKILEGYIDEVAAENSSWDFFHVDVDKYQELAMNYGIMGIPSFVALENGSVVGDLISKDAKPKNLINNWIKSIEAGIKL